MEILIRRAKLADTADIRKLIGHYAREKRLLPRQAEEIKKAYRNFFVAVCDGTLIGCVALEIYSKKLAEIRSLAVNRHWKGLNIGSALIQVCLARAKSRRIAEVMAITSSEKFFEKQGFSFALPNEKKALFYWTK